MSQRNDFIPITIAAHRLGLSIGFLRLAKRTGLGPPSVDVGDELCYYWPSVLSWARRTGFDRNLDPPPPARCPTTRRHARTVRVGSGRGASGKAGVRK